MNDVSLQINLSAGDIEYADQTVAALARAHRECVKEVFLVVDCLRPGRTKIVDPDLRFPQAEFEKKVQKIVQIAKELKNSGVVDRVECLRVGDEILSLVAKKYLRGIVQETHDYGGCGLVSYLSGIELARTQFVVHYDADMLLHQEDHYHWVKEGCEVLQEDSTSLAVTPRVAPPTHGLREKPSLYEWPPVTTGPHGWRDQWLSTRCFLLDTSRFQCLLPLLRGRVLWDVLLVKYLGGGYPRSPEVMISHRMVAERMYRTTLQSDQAWLLHPVAKSKQFLRLLPSLIRAVEQGDVPEQQRGIPDIKLEFWESEEYENSLHV